MTAARVAGDRAWTAAAIALVAGAGMAVALALPPAGRSLASYAGGLAVAGVVLAAASCVVARAARRSPALSLVAALGSYALTIVGFAIALAVLDRDALELRAWAAGLAVAAVLATGVALRRGTVRRL